MTKGKLYNIYYISTQAISSASLKVGMITINNIIDDDDFGVTATDTTLATAESIKAYVDANAGGVAGDTISSNFFLKTSGQTIWDWYSASGVNLYQISTNLNSKIDGKQDVLDGSEYYPSSLGNDLNEAFLGHSGQTNKHIDWTVDQGATNINVGNYTNTTYTAGTGIDLNGTEFSVDQGEILSTVSSNAKSAYDWFVASSQKLSNISGTQAGRLDTLEGYVNQDVTTNSAPTFTADNFSDGGSNAIITTTQETNFTSAYTWFTESSQSLSAGIHDQVTLDGSYDYISITDQVITRNQIDLTTDVTGVLPDANVANDITLTNITQISNRDHHDLEGLLDDDHTQYYNSTRLDSYTGTMSSNALTSYTWFTESSQKLSVAYTERGSQIAGDNLTWDGSQLNATAGGGTSTTYWSSQTDKSTGSIYYDGGEVVIAPSGTDYGDYRLQVSGTSFFSGNSTFKGSTISGMTYLTINGGISGTSMSGGTLQAGNATLGGSTISGMTSLTVNGGISGTTFSGTQFRGISPMTYSVNNIQISANQNLNMARFKCPTGKKAYIYQAYACGSGGTGIGELYVEMLADSNTALVGADTVYKTSSAELQQGNPLASCDAGDYVEIRFMYSGTSATPAAGAGYKYGNAMMQVGVY